MTALLDALVMVSREGGPPESLYLPMATPGRGASIETLFRRARYAGRKGHRARMRIVDLIRRAPAWVPPWVSTWKRWP